jgi:hypothetical protein
MYTMDIQRTQIAQQIICNVTLFILTLTLESTAMLQYWY